MTRAGQDGFTLIEAVFAGVVLAVGLLAMAGMQSMSLGRNVDANELTRVTNLAADMMERIQFNRARAAAYNGALGTGIDTLNAATQPPATEPMARGDYTQWQALLNSSGLTGVQGLITVTALDPAPAVNPVTLNRSAVTVTINWTGRVTLGQVGTTLGGMEGEGAPPVAVVTTRPRQLVLATIVAPE